MPRTYTYGPSVKPLDHVDSVAADKSANGVLSASTGRAGQGARSQPVSNRGQRAAPEREYLEILKKHSLVAPDVSAFSGFPHRKLVQFLVDEWRPSAIDAVSPRSSSQHDEDFTVLRFELTDRLLKFPRFQNISRPPRNERGLFLDQENTNQGSLVFIRGYPSANTILRLGSAYSIDPEFFRRHMTFGRTNEVNNATVSGFLPSFRHSIFQLDFTSVARLEKPIKRELSTARTASIGGMKRYHDSFRNSKQWTPGASMVRSCAIHDAAEVSIVQTATVALVRPSKESRSWHSFIWLDAGRNLARSPSGPWVGDDETSHMKFYPINLHKDDIAFFDHADETARDHDWRDSDFVQLLDRLPLFYGKSLNAGAAAIDPFYALNELFTLSATSENIFLNAISNQIDRQDQHLAGSNARPLLDIQANLVYFKTILQEHLTHINSTSTIIKSRHLLKWRQSNARTDVPKIEEAAIKLEGDWEFLLQKATNLLKRCENDMAVLMTQAALDEARRNAAQSGRVVRLTLLASFFVPLAFTATVFGMNFVKFESPARGVWVWVAVTVPIFVFSFLVIIWDHGRAKQWLRNRHERFTQVKSIKRKLPPNANAEKLNVTDRRTGSLV